MKPFRRLFVRPLVAASQRELSPKVMPGNTKFQVSDFTFLSLFLSSQPSLFLR